MSTRQWPRPRQPPRHSRWTAPPAAPTPGTPARDTRPLRQRRDDGLKIGIKFDQPGLGLKTGSEYTGFDVDVATYVAKELGSDADEITWVAGAERPARDPDRERPGRPGRRDLLDQRRAQGEGRLRRPVLHRPPGPAGPRRRHLDHRARRPQREEALLGHRLHLGAERQGQASPDVQLQEFATYSECLPALENKGVDALTTDDTILAGYAAQPKYEGKFKVVGKPFTEENYGIGLKKGDNELCDQDQRRDQEDDRGRLLAEGHRRQPRPGRLQARAGNPPTPAACSDVVHDEGCRPPARADGIPRSR